MSLSLKFNTRSLLIRAAGLGGSDCVFVDSEPSDIPLGVVRWVLIDGAIGGRFFFVWF
jgi:hypothetical protein